MVVMLYIPKFFYLRSIGIMGLGEKSFQVFEFK